MIFTITDAKRKKNLTFVAFLRVDGWKVARLEGHTSQSVAIITNVPGFRSPVGMGYPMSQLDLLSMVHRKLEEQEAPAREWRFDLAMDRARRRGHRMRDSSP